MVLYLFGTGTLMRSWAMLSSPSNPADRACRSNSAKLGVALREVGQDEMPYTRVPGDGGGLSGRQMAVVGGEADVLVEERRLDDEHVGALGEGVHAVAEPGVHDEGEALPAPDLADLVEGHAVQGALALDPAHVGALDVVRGEPLGQDAAPVGLGEPVTVRLDGVGEPVRVQGVRVGDCERPVGGDRGWASSTVSR